MAAGFSGGLRVVSERTTRRRRTDVTPSELPGKPPSARYRARLLTTGRDHLSRRVAIVIDTIERAVPMLVVARDLVDSFHSIVRAHKADALDAWVAQASIGLLASFAAGIVADHKAVAAAITELWSNGQTEGQITKLKMIKRQMFGRAGLDLLRSRLSAA